MKFKLFLQYEHVELEVDAIFISIRSNMVLWLKTQTGPSAPTPLWVSYLNSFASELLSVKGDDVNDSIYPMYTFPY